MCCKYLLSSLRNINERAKHAFPYFIVALDITVHAMGGYVNIEQPPSITCQCCLGSYSYCSLYLQFLKEREFGKGGSAFFLSLFFLVYFFSVSICQFKWSICFSAPVCWTTVWCSGDVPWLNIGEWSDSLGFK